MTSSSSSRGRRLPMIFMLLAMVVATAVAIGVALSAGMAVAKKQAKAPATIEATTFQVANGLTDEAYAKCPSNKRVVGGGVVEVGPPNGLYVRASGPLDETGSTIQTTNGDIATQWYAAVSNTTTGPVTLKVFAICSAKSDATIEATSFQVPGGRSGEASAVCPPNKRALGGGVVEVGPPDKIGVKASGPLDDTGSTTATQSGDIATQWYAAVRNYSGLVTFKVFAICQ
jgi:hypothetical protein